MDLSTIEGRKQQGLLIKVAALTSGISLEELANKIGCSRALIYQYVAGKLLPQNNRLQQIGKVTNRPLSFFFKDEPVEKQSTSGKSKSSLEPAALKSSKNEELKELRLLIGAYSNPVDERAVRKTSEKMAALAEELSESIPLAEALFMLGYSSFNLGEYKDSQEAYLRSLSIFEARHKANETILCRQNLGRLYLTQGNIAEAEKQFEFVVDSSVWLYRWQGEVSLAAINEHRGEFKSAEARLDRCEAMLGLAPDEESERTADLYIRANRINLLIATGDYSSARTLSEQMLEIAESSGEYEQYLESLINLGICDHALGAWRRAGIAFSRANVLAKMVKNSDRQILSNAYLSALAASAGQFERATVWGAEALESAVRSGAWRGEIAARASLIQAYLRSGMLTDAEYHCEQAVKICKRINHIPLCIKIRTAEAEILRQKGKLEESSRVCSALLKQCITLETLNSKLRVHITLGNIFFEQEHYNLAKEQADSAVSLAESLALPDDLWEALTLRGKSFKALDDCVNTEKDFVRAIDKLELLRNETEIKDPLHLTNEPSIDTLLEQKNRIEPFILFHEILESQGRKQEALELLERAGLGMESRLPYKMLNR